MRRDPSISFLLDLDVTLSPKEVFPDGIPDDWSIADVVAAVKKSGSVREWLSDWNMEPSLAVITDKPNPAYKGDDALFEPPSPRLIDREEVW